MKKPRVIIVDEDSNFLIALQHKFVTEFFNKIDLEVISDKNYFEKLFAVPQSVEILIISEKFYASSLRRHNIDHIFIMMEQIEDVVQEDPILTKLFKYSSVKEIFIEITGKSEEIFNIDSVEKKETQILLFTSASGGVGKTAIAMGVATCLTQDYRRVLYVNASKLNTFQYKLNNNTPINGTDIYSKLLENNKDIYDEIKNVIRKEEFSYLPPFRAALLSLGIKYDIYEKIILGAKKSGEYDYIVVDGETSFGDNESRLIDFADKVIVVTKQNMGSIFATNIFYKNVNGANSEKFIYICNDFDAEKKNIDIDSDIKARFSINGYVEHISELEYISLREFSEKNSIRRISVLVM